MSNPRNLTAGTRESGTLCAHCTTEIKSGDATSICRDCGAVHHSQCWDAAGGCRAYECSSAAKMHANGSAAILTITREALAAAQPLPSRSIAVADETAGSGKG